MSTGPLRTINPPATDKAGFKVVQHTLTLTRRVGAASTAQTAVSGAGFVNPNNANGLHDAAFAVLTGSATAAQAGTLTGSYTDPDSSKALFTISSVKFSLYYKVAGDTLSSAATTCTWQSTNLGSATLETVAGGTRDHSVTPLVVDVTARVAGLWSNLNGLKVVFTGSTPLANTAVISLDSVELEIVTATLTTAQ